MNFFLLLLICLGVFVLLAGSLIVFGDLMLSKAQQQPQRIAKERLVLKRIEEDGEET
jgi:hypothetical protein